MSAKDNMKCKAGCYSIDGGHVTGVSGDTKIIF
jgi:hypothetical protein